MTFWALIIYVAILAVGCGICWQLYVIQRERDETEAGQIHRRQQYMLKQHHKAMRLWRKRDIKPRAWWKRWAD